MRGASEQRKIDHIEICLSEKVEANTPTGFEDINLIHQSIPEIALDDVNLEAEFLDYKLKAPLIIEPMTGGHQRALKINRNLAKAAEELGIAIGVGSQRAALEDEALAATFKVIRESTTEVPILANIGCAQLNIGEYIEVAQMVVEMIDADALTIHLNPLQESIQSEGNTNFKGVLDSISTISRGIDVPVIVKETGAGISMETAKRLEESGVTIVDVAGLGGTSWAGVEFYRAKRGGDHRGVRLGKTFWNWGIPTVVSLVEVIRSTSLSVIASGGVREGLDVAKAIALGAEMAGLALPLLKPATEGVEAVKNVIKEVIEELKVAMFLCSSIDLKSLRKAPLIIGGDSLNWLKARGVDLSAYTQLKII